MKVTKIAIPKGPERIKSIDISFLCDLNGSNKVYYEVL